MNLRLRVALSLFTVLLSVRVGLAEETIERKALSARTHSTWEGSYAYSDEIVLGIENREDLHILVYRHVGKEGTLIEFARALDSNLRVLRPPNTNIKGVTPSLEGIDVLPGANEAEVLVRWRHLGEGGLRSVDKYIYSASGLSLEGRSDFVTDGKRIMWISGETSQRSTPATYSPRSGKEYGE